MKSISKFLQHSINKIQEVIDKECSNIEKASEILANTYLNEGRIFAFGTGHSHMIAEEIYTRAGGFAPVKNLTDGSLMLHEMPLKSTMIERLSGYAKILLDLNKINEKDTLIIISNSGRNEAIIEMATEAKKIGCSVIAITSMKHSSSVTSRSNLGKKLYEVSDVTIDNVSEIGDASFFINGLVTPVGATSSITGTAISQAIIAGTVEILVDKGLDVPVFRSSNLDGADEYNQKLFDKYHF